MVPRQRVLDQVGGGGGDGDAVAAGGVAAG
jgi:hypothetical protein